MKQKIFLYFLIIFIQVEKIEKGDENGIEGEVSGANNFDDNNLDEEANDQEKTETKDSKGNTGEKNCEQKLK